MTVFIRIAAAVAVGILVVGATSLAASPSPSPVVLLPSPGPSPATTTYHITVTGTHMTGMPRRLTVDLPSEWFLLPGGAQLGVTESDWTAFLVSIIDNTYADPCAHTLRSPKVASTVEAAAAALADIPGTTSTAPVPATIAGQEATYLEITIPASLPCALNEFYLWQDGPGRYYLPVAFNEVFGVWLFDMDGRPVAVATRTLPGTTDATKARLQAVLDSLVLLDPSGQPGPTPAAS